MQGGQVSSSRAEPLKFKTTGKDGEDLEINGKSEYTMKEQKSNGDALVLVIHKKGT